MILGGISAAQVSSAQNDPQFALYRSGITANRNACEEAAAGTVVGVANAPSPGDVTSICSRASTFRDLGFASFTVGGIFLGAGALLTLTSDTVYRRLFKKKGETASQGLNLQILPAAGPQGGGATLRWRF